MAGMGPPPKAQKRRRNVVQVAQVLPSEGRTGDAPEWPLFGDQERDELAVWEQMWRTPQAKAWERLGWTRTVARYCRVLVKAEAGLITALPEARQLEDRLGLTPMAMMRLRWEIAPDEVSDRREESAEARPRRRLNLAGGGDAVAGA